MTRTPLLLAAILTCASAFPAAAFVEPPVTGPRDAACRQEARENILTAPNPDGLDLFQKGRRIWTACMARGEGKAGITKASQSR